MKENTTYNTFVIAANSVPGTHEGQLTCTLDMSIDKHLLLTAGSVAGHVKTCGDQDQPIGLAMQAGTGGDLVSVALLGATRASHLIRTASPIHMGEPVYSAGLGRVCGRPKACGSYHQVGVALTSAAVGELVEVDTHVGIKTDVVVSEEK